MARLKFTSETGMFHSALCADFGQGPEWYGYGPMIKGRPHGVGGVHTDDRTNDINHEINFIVDDGVLRAAIDAAVIEFTTTTYTVGVHDCVSFTAQIARKCGMTVPSTNFLPYNFLKALAAANKYESFR